MCTLSNREQDVRYAIDQFLTHLDTEAETAVTAGRWPQEALENAEQMQALLRAKADEIELLLHKPSFGHLGRSVEELECSVRVYNVLKNNNIRTIRELVLKTKREMLMYKNFGKRSLAEVEQLLAPMGLTLGMQLPITTEA
jgi:DNA-directed RNA polymerase alpha subunit